MERPILSPAKVNLLLKVVSKRADGYHDLVSIVDIVSIYDVMRLKERPDGEVMVRDYVGSPSRGTDNTIYRAIMLLKETLQRRLRAWRSFVEKNIPMGSGLGGGAAMRPR